MGKFFKGKARKVKAPAYSVSVGNGAMWVDFFVDEKDARGCYLTVKDCHGTFEHRVTGHTYGYLLTAVRKGRESEAEAYAYMIWMVSHEVYNSLEFCANIVKACNDFANRMYKTDGKGFTLEREDGTVVVGEENPKNAEESDAGSAD